MLKVKVAIASDCTTALLEENLKTEGLQRGLALEILSTPLMTVEKEFLEPGSKLRQFAPEIVFGLPATQSARLRFYERSSTIESYSQEEIARIKALWDRARKEFGATIIQANFALPCERPFGSFDSKTGESFHSVVASWNRGMEELSRGLDDVLIFDLESVASWFGREKWFDERLWFVAESPFALEFVPAVSRRFADILAALKQRATKCVVVDLDNTLWGGVVADVGPGGLEIGGSPEGKAYREFQGFLRELKRRGIVLAVCSKNDPEVARQPFLSRPEMLLKEEDFAVFIANREDKATNIRQIQAVLQIGLDSIVFIDDEPFERHWVRHALPDVRVPELPEDVADRVKHLSERNLFETVRFTEEDRMRAARYREEGLRQQAGHAFESADDFLKSLEMKMSVYPLDELCESRAIQLAQRTNQFNLTNQGLTQEQCRNFAKDPAMVPLCFSLKDRFGDYGMISLAILKKDPAFLTIESWYMSCRVLNRGSEQCIIEQIIEIAKKNGIPRVVGKYKASEKNALVKDLFESLGFCRKPGKEIGQDLWEIEVARYSPRTSWIAVERGRGHA